MQIVAETDRLILRTWQEADKPAFARLNADPRVMEFLPGVLSSEESDRIVDRIVARLASDGFGLYAAERKQSGQFMGFIGLAVPSFEASFTPCVEIGWRIAAEFWGQGLATEGARAVARHAFRALQLAEIVSFTVPANVRSRRVMDKIGMRRDPAGDFDHPRLPVGHPLRPHVLYRLDRP